MQSSRIKRRRERLNWSLTCHPLTEDVDQLINGSVSSLVAMVWPITLDAWASAGLSIPDYNRATIPGRIIRTHDSSVER